MTGGGSSLALKELYFNQVWSVTESLYICFMKALLLLFQQVLFFVLLW